MVPSERFSRTALRTHLPQRAWIRSRAAVLGLAPHSQELALPSLWGGAGRVSRPQRKPDNIFTGLFKGPVEDYDAADEGGLRRCLHGGCRNGRVDPRYGASNSFIRAPGLLERHPGMSDRLGARGLSSPSLEETLAVLDWTEWLYPKLLAGEAL